MLVTEFRDRGDMCAFSLLIFGELEAVLCEGETFDSFTFVVLFENSRDADS